MKLSKKGQNVVEYILMFTAVLIVLIYFITHRTKFDNAVTGYLETSVDIIDNGTRQIQFNTEK